MFFLKCNGMGVIFVWFIVIFDMLVVIKVVIIIVNFLVGLVRD